MEDEKQTLKMRSLGSMPVPFAFGTPGNRSCCTCGHSSRSSDQSTSTHASIVDVAPIQLGGAFST